jgi:hypothetical protein
VIRIHAAKRDIAVERHDPVNPGMNHLAFRRHVGSLESPVGGEPARGGVADDEQREADRDGDEPRLLDSNLHSGTPSRRPVAKEYETILR